MNRDQMIAPFAEEELQTFAGRGGKTMTYIEDETVMDRLDAGYGYGNWQLQVEEARAEGVVKVRLGVRETGEWVWYEDFGYANREGGETLKEAVTDGIRRCGRMVGIARDLYRKSTYEPGGSLGPKPKRQPPRERDIEDPGPTEQRTTHRDGLIGKAIAQGTQDFALRQGPDGPVLPFRIKEGRLSQIAVAKGPIAVALDTYRDEVLGNRVTVWGTYSDETYTKKDKDGDPYDVTYKVLHVERIKTPAFEMPPENVPEERLDAAEREAHYAAAAIVGVGPNAPEPLFPPLTDEEMEAIGAGAPG